MDERIEQRDGQSAQQVRAMLDGPMYEGVVLDNYAHYEQFCDGDSNALRVYELKASMDTLGVPEREFARARGKSNPAEEIGHSIFQNRAALKLANMDAIYSLTAKMGTFVDLCAGPGGFVEYIYWRHGERNVRGWGMTLRGGSMDFDVANFCPQALPATTFVPFYGKDGTGNIMSEDNLLELRRTILAGTDGRGVDLVTADGGIGVDGRENLQEVCTKRLLLCEIIAALLVLRRGGRFMCKLFDAFTPFTVDLLFVLHRLFATVCITKPITSRPANSERYVVALGRLDSADAPSPIVDMLLCSVNRRLAALEALPLAALPSLRGLPPGMAAMPRALIARRDIVRIFPDRVLTAEFVRFLAASNRDVSRTQIKYLLALHNHIRRPSLPPDRFTRDEIAQLYSSWAVPLLWPDRTAPSGIIITAKAARAASADDAVDIRQKKRQRRDQALRTIGPTGGDDDQCRLSQS